MLNIYFASQHDFNLNLKMSIMYKKKWNKKFECWHIYIHITPIPENLDFSLTCMKILETKRPIESIWN